MYHICRYLSIISFIFYFNVLYSCYPKQFSTHYKLTSISAKIEHIYHSFNDTHGDTTLYFIVSIHIQKKDDKKGGYSIHKQDYRSCVSENYKIKDINVLFGNQKIEMKNISLWKLDDEINAQNDKIDKFIENINECKNYRKTMCKICFVIKKENVKNKKYLKIFLQNNKSLMVRL